MDKIRTSRSNDEFLGRDRQGADPRRLTRPGAGPGPAPSDPAYNGEDHEDRHSPRLHDRVGAVLVREHLHNAIDQSPTCMSELCNECHPFYTGKQKLAGHRRTRGALSSAATASARPSADSASLPPSTLGIGVAVVYELANGLDLPPRSVARHDFARATRSQLAGGRAKSCAMSPAQASISAPVSEVSLRQPGAGGRQLAEGPAQQSRRVRVECSEEDAVTTRLDDFLKLGDLLGHCRRPEVLSLRRLGPRCRAARC